MRCRWARSTGRHLDSGSVRSCGPSPRVSAGLCISISQDSWASLKDHLPRPLTGPSAGWASRAQGAGLPCSRELCVHVRGQADAALDGLGARLFGLVCDGVRGSSTD